jgi:peroxiredoxin
MNKTVLFIFFLAVSVVLPAQTIHLNCKPLSGKPAKLYWQKGENVDSLLISLDNDGKATLHLPDGIRKVLATLVIDKNGVQFIAGEPDITLTCTAAPLSKQNIKITGSPENDFLYRIFDGKATLMHKQAWLEAGLQQYDSKSPLYPLLASEKRQAMEQYNSLVEEERTSSLFAAGFLQMNGFLDRLYDVEHARDSIREKTIQKEMEETLDFTVLYSCGQLWNSVPNYYLSMFNRIDKADKRESFATSACKILDRLQEPYYWALLSNFVKETERFGWLGAGETIVKHALATRPGIKDAADVSSQVKRILSIVNVTARTQAPLLQITTTSVNANGFSHEQQTTVKPEGKNGALLIFYETGCEFCSRELKQIRENYVALQQKGIRVISIASDTDRKTFESWSNNFPWNDKLFDDKGFVGENFKNYAVLGTPTLFIIDKENKIAGRYATLEETGLIGK